MEALSLAFGIILMLVAAVGIVLYVALVIAIPVCRLLDWLAGEEPGRANGRPALRDAGPTTRRLPTGLARIGRLAGSASRQWRSPADHDRE
jgi:hypothetical protein